MSKCVDGEEKSNVAMEILKKMFNLDRVVVMGEITISESEAGTRCANIVFGDIPADHMITLSAKTLAVENGVENVSDNLKVASAAIVDGLLHNVEVSEEGGRSI